MPILDPAQHGAHGPNFGLSDRPCAFHVNDDAVVGIDEIIGLIAKECGPFAGSGPLTGGVGMRCELGLNLRCCTKGCIVEDIQVLLHGARRIIWIDDAAIPIFLWRRVLFVRISLNQTGVCSKPLPAHQTICDAAGNGLLEQMPQQFAFPKAPMPVLGECRMVRHWVRQIEAAEPTVREVQMDFFAQPTLGSNAKAIADQQHADQQLRINRWTACVAIKSGQILADIT